MQALDLSKPACGATLIAPKVVATAAHCVTDAGATFAFGTGDVGKGEIVRVVERHAHPSFHPESQGMFDITHALRNYDVAYLVLERAITSAKPAALATSEASMNDEVQAIGYHAGLRKSTPAYVTLQVELGSDPIIEVHPEDSALCIEDGDDGSAIVMRDASAPVLVGIFVGSVTGGFTDCKRGSQYLNGYESAYGYRDFLNAGIVSAHEER
jgi:secreted trypsin-like serine protease